MATFQPASVPAASTCAVKVPVEAAPKSAAAPQAVKVPVEAAPKSAAAPQAVKVPVEAMNGFLNATGRRLTGQIRPLGKEPKLG